MKKFKKISALLFISASMLTAMSCTNNGEDPGSIPGGREPNITVGPENLEFALEEITKSLNVTVKDVDEWSVGLDKAEDSSWLSFSRNGDIVTVVVTRPEAGEEPLEGVLVFTDDYNEAEAFRVSVKALMPSPVPDPQYTLDTDEKSLTFNADDTQGQTITVVTDIPSWTASVGVDYLDWITAETDGNVVTIKTGVWTNKLRSRFGTVIILADNGEAEPVEINIEQLPDTKPVIVTEPELVAYYGDHYGKGTGRFVIQIEQNGIADGFYIEAFDDLAADPDNFSPRLGDYTPDTDGTCAAGTYKIGMRISNPSSGGMFKTDFEGTRVYVSNKGAIDYKIGTMITNGTLALNKEGDNYVISTDGLKGIDMKTGDTADNPTVYSYTGSLTFENREMPTDESVYTGTVTDGRVSWGSWGNQQRIGFLIEGSWAGNYNMNINKTAPYKFLDTTTTGYEWENEPKSQKEIWAGEYRFDGQTSSPGYIYYGRYNDSTHTQTCYIEGDGLGNETIILITGGTMTIATAQGEHAYSITTNLTGKNARTDGAAKVQITGQTEVTKN